MKKLLCAALCLTPIAAMAAGAAAPVSGIDLMYLDRSVRPRADQLVKNVLAAYKDDIDTLDWMSPPTRQKAQAKLAKFTPQIGYPDKWRDYSALKIVKGDLIGDVQRGNEFEYRRNLNKLGKPVDRNGWTMTP